jgi:hypothetical protein
MAHNIQWDNQTKTVVLHEYTDGATKDDLFHLVEQSAQMLQTVRHMVHLIIDERKINLMLTPADMSYLEKWKPRNQGIIVIIVTSEQFKQKQAMVDLMQRTGMKTADNAYYAGSVEEARQFLQQGFGILYS